MLKLYQRLPGSLLAVGVLLLVKLSYILRLIITKVVAQLDRKQVAYVKNVQRLFCVDTLTLERISNHANAGGVRTMVSYDFVGTSENLLIYPCHCKHCNKMVGSQSSIAILRCFLCRLKGTETKFAMVRCYLIRQKTKAQDEL